MKTYFNHLSENDLEILLRETMKHINDSDKPFVKDLCNEIANRQKSKGKCEHGIQKDLVCSECFAEMKKSQ